MVEWMWCTGHSFLRYLVKIPFLFSPLKVSSISVPTECKFSNRLTCNKWAFSLGTSSRCSLDTLVMDRLLVTNLLNDITLS